VDPGAYTWRHAGWRGRPWEEAVVYELHVGTFTPEGTFAAARERLAELAALGITAIELMPVADFPGTRNWGYDGVLQYAPDASYGTPNDLKALVDEAHGHGLMVLLDVVYNHFGPDGNYLHAYCPQFFNAKRKTPWGAAINFDGEGSRTVRDFYLHNALYWVEEYAFDGLRLDAVHAIRDDSDTHIVCEIARALRAGPGRERAVHLVLENGANQARFLGPCGTAQWNDDLHHAAHVLVTGETDGYYADYAERPLERFGRALAEGFVYQNDPSAFRDGERRGEPSAHLPSTAFVSFLQTHDQVGNRALGERLHALGDAARERAALACLLLSPHVPMLFMGEEYAATTPFLYFCDFGLALAKAVAAGRREEFSRFAAFADPKARAAIPDPGSMDTFARSKLDWPCRARAPHRERLALVGELLRLRREHVVPRLAGMPKGGRYAVQDGVLRVSWMLGDRSTLHLATDVATGPGVAGTPLPGAPIYADDAVRCTLEAARD
jgi:maltooligosyltrehalose trehalohydrolase